MHLGPWLLVLDDAAEPDALCQPCWHHCIHASAWRRDDQGVATTYEHTGIPGILPLRLRPIHLAGAARTLRWWLPLDRIPG